MNIGEIGWEGLGDKGRNDRLRKRKKNRRRGIDEEGKKGR